MRGLMIVIMALLLSVNCFARGGGGAHGGDAGRGGYDSSARDARENYNQNRNDRNNYNNGYWGIGNTGTVLEAPVSGAYSTTCSNVQVCDQVGNCWMQQSCN